MPTPIEIKVGQLKLKAELFDTETARAISDVLPFELNFNRWGDEFYFKVPIELMELDDTATSRVKVGDIGYWPDGNAMCIFFGKTPMSEGEEPVPASDVNIIGRIVDDAHLLKEVVSVDRISIKRIE